MAKRVVSDESVRGTTSLIVHDPFNSVWANPVQHDYFLLKKSYIHVYNLYSLLSAFRPRGVPGPTSKLSPRAPAQMGRRETEREGGKPEGERRKRV
jgi:hypothetical protein